MDVTGQYLEWLKLSGYSDDTIRTRRALLRRLERELGRPPERASAAELLAWRKMIGGRVSSRTVIRYVSNAAVFYDWLVRQEIRADNPAGRIPVPRSGRLLPRPVGEQDLARAIALAHQPVRAWLVLAGCCGLRCKEIALLRRESVLDTASQPLLIVTAEASKGRKERTIPLSGYVLGELLAFGLPARGFVFGRQDGQPGPNTPARVSQAIGIYLRSVGIAASAHQFRHRFGSQAYAAGLDPVAVQELMGHSSLRTTSGYMAISSAQAARVIAAMPVPGAGLRAVS